MSIEESIPEGEGLGTFPTRCRHRACWALCPGLLPWSSPPAPG